MRVAAQGDAEATLGRMHYDGDVACLKTLLGRVGGCGLNAPPWGISAGYAR